MSIRTLSVCLAVALATPLLVTDAHAAKVSESKEADVPQVEMTGIEAFDSVFRQVKEIHDTLDRIQGRLDGATNAIAAAVGQPEGTSLAMSMWELKQQVQGPIDVKLQGTKPVLTVGGNGSAEAQAAIQKVNGAVVEVAQLPADLAQLPPQVMKLVEACKGFPAQLNPQLLADAGLKPLELPKIAKVLGRNVKATAATPQRIESLAATAKGVLTGIPDGLAATEAPTEEYLAEKKADKKAKKDTAEAGPVLATVLSPRVDAAMSAFHDAEVRQAMELLAQVDAELPRLNQPIPQQDLEALYQSQALVHMVGGNAAGASAAVAQALVIDPDADPMDHLGPEYAKLHKLMRKADLLQVVQVPVEGSGHALVSGQEVSGSSIELPAGRHLLQVERNGAWTSQFIWVQDGFSLTL